MGSFFDELVERIHAALPGIGQNYTYSFTENPDAPTLTLNIHASSIPLDHIRSIEEVLLRYLDEKFNNYTGLVLISTAPHYKGATGFVGLRDEKTQ